MLLATRVVVNDLRLKEEDKDKESSFKDKDKDLSSKDNDLKIGPRGYSRTRIFLEDNNSVAIYLTAVQLWVFLDFIIKTIQKLSQLTPHGEKSKTTAISV